MEIEGQESVVETSENAESQSPTPESSQSEPAAQVAAPKPDDTQIDWDKAFKHERFQQLIGQKNEALEKSRSLELKLAQLEGRLQSQPSAQAQAEKDELIEDLKKVDPRLAARLEGFGNSAKTIAELQAKLEKFEQSQVQSQQQQTVKESVSRINSWHDANKVPQAVRNAVNAQLDVMYMQGKLNPEGLEKAYKEAYEPFKSYAEELKRETLKGYVPEKKRDAATPTSQPKGAPAPKAKSSDKVQFKDKEELRAAVAKEYVQNARAKRDASPV